MNNTTFGRGTKNDETLTHKANDHNIQQLICNNNNNNPLMTLCIKRLSRKIEIEWKQDIRGRDIDINIAPSHLTDSIT